MKRQIFGGLLVLTAFAALPLWAHHSTSAEFDMTKKMTVSGKLLKVDWINPHIAIDIEAKGADGKVESWRLESSPPAWFKRVGVNRSDFTRALGQNITVEGVRAKNGTLYGYMQKVTFADGVVLELVSGSAAEK